MCPHAMWRGGSSAVGKTSRGFIGPWRIRGGFMIIPGIGPNWLTRDHEAETVSRRKKTIRGRRKGHAGGGTGSQKNRPHAWNADLRLGERQGRREETLALSLANRYDRRLLEAREHGEADLSAASRAIPRHRRPLGDDRADHSSQGQGRQRAVGTRRRHP